MTWSYAEYTANDHRVPTIDRPMRHRTLQLELDFDLMADAVRTYPLSTVVWQRWVPILDRKMASNMMPMLEAMTAGEA